MTRRGDHTELLATTTIFPDSFTKARPMGMLATKAPTIRAVTMDLTEMPIPYWSEDSERS